MPEKQRDGEKTGPSENPFLGVPDFRTMQAGPYRFRAKGPRVIANFFDVAHLRGAALTESYLHSP
jgi:hypothetical protein